MEEENSKENVKKIDSAGEEHIILVAHKQRKNLDDSAARNPTRKFFALMMMFAGKTGRTRAVERANLTPQFIRMTILSSRTVLYRYAQSSQKYRI